MPIRYGVFFGIFRISEVIAGLNKSKMLCSCGFIFTMKKGVWGLENISKKGEQNSPTRSGTNLERRRI